MIWHKLVENTSVLCIEDSTSGIPHKAANFFTFLPSYVGLMASNSTGVFQYPDFCTFNFNLKKRHRLWYTVQANAAVLPGFYKFLKERKELTNQFRIWTMSVTLYNIFALGPTRWSLAKDLYFTSWELVDIVLRGDDDHNTLFLSTFCVGKPFYQERDQRPK